MCSAPSRSLDPARKPLQLLQLPASSCVVPKRYFHQWKCFPAIPHGRRPAARSTTFHSVNPSAGPSIDGVCNHSLHDQAMHLQLQLC